MNGLMKLNVLHSGYIKVINPLTDEVITGLVTGDFGFSVIANDIPSADSVTIGEIGAGEYNWYHVATVLGSRKITISYDLDIYGITQSLKWPFAFEVVANDLQDVYDLSELIYQAVLLISPGTGSELVSVFAKELISELPVPEADYEIWDENNLIRLHSGTDPDADGQQDFLLNPGNYNIRLRKVSWNFPTVVPITVLSGGLSETIHGEKLVPSSPPAPDLCVIWGYTIGVNGEVLPEATVKATIKNPEVFQDMSKIADADNETTSDINGYFELALIPNELFSPLDTKYSFVVEKGDFRFESPGIVPNTTSAEFKNILVSEDP